MIPDFYTDRGLALVGSRATGKTTVGRILGMRLGRSFVDTDDQVQRVSGAGTIREVFAQWGEPHFRDLEEVVLKGATQEPGRIVATGGGIVLREANRKVLREYGFVVWLTADPEVLAERLRADPRGLNNRPALTAAGTLEEIAEVMAVRTPLYQEVADAIVDTTGRTAEEVAEAVMVSWSDFESSSGGVP
jgi:shikimate kinase